MFKNMKPLPRFVRVKGALQPRKKKRRTEANYTEEDLKEAMKLVLNENWSQSQASRAKGIPIKTLGRYLRKIKKGGGIGDISIHRGVRTIFPAELEQSFVDYIQYRANIGRGLTALAVREAAYRIALSNNIENFPPSWREKKIAGLEWFLGFRERHPTINLRQHGVSITGSSPALSFDQFTIEMFFDNLESVYKQYPSVVERFRIYNLDEIALTTAQRPGNILALNESKKSKEVSQQNSGAFVTACCIIQADGSFLPPAMVFPTEEYAPKLIKFAPVDTRGMINATGRMTGELFLKVMQHFVLYSNSSVEDPTILICDNHESHHIIDVVDFAHENGVILLKSPPHCSDNFQPLTVSVFGRLKKSYNLAIDDHLLQNPGNPISTDDVGGLFNKAFHEVMTPSNITAGFLATGIYEFNRDVFLGKDFSKSLMADEQEASTFTAATLSPVSAPVTQFELLETENTTGNISSNGSLSEPEMILGYP